MSIVRIRPEAALPNVRDGRKAAVGLRATLGHSQLAQRAASQASNQREPPAADPRHAVAVPRTATKRKNRSRRVWRQNFGFIQKLQARRCYGTIVTCGFEISVPFEHPFGVSLQDPSLSMTKLVAD